MQGDTGELSLDRIPTSRILEAEVNDRREAEHDHKELEHLGVDRGGESSLEDIKKNDQGTDPETDVVFPAKELIKELGQGIQGDAGGEDRHHREGDRIEGTGAFVKTEFQVLGNGSGLRAVVEGHHEDREEDHRGNRPHPVEVAGRDAVLGTRGRHAHEFQRPEVGGEEGEPRHPGRDVPTGEEEVGRGLHLALQREADADNEDHVKDEDRICLLYTSDAADEEDSVDLGGRRIIKKNYKTKKNKIIKIKNYE